MLLHWLIELNHALFAGWFGRGCVFFGFMGIYGRGSLTGDFKRFGALMNASCQSSIHQYECGSDPLISLHEIALGTLGVLGSRFSGGGFGGCLVALAKRDYAKDAIETILEKYRLIYPEKADACRGWIASGVDGATLRF